MIPLSELLSWSPGVSMIPGRCGRNEDRESFIFFAAKVHSCIMKISLRNSLSFYTYW